MASKLSPRLAMPNTTSYTNQKNHHAETILTIPHCDEGDAGIWLCTATFTNRQMTDVPRSSYTTESRYHLNVGGDNNCYHIK